MITDAQIKAACDTDLIALIGQTVALKRCGEIAIGLCPFHREKTVSFNVSNVRRRYRCFGCGFSGDAIAWVMWRDGCGFRDAVERLIGRSFNPQPLTSQRCPAQSRWLIVTPSICLTWQGLSRERSKYSMTPIQF